MKFVMLAAAVVAVLASPPSARAAEEWQIRREVSKIDDSTNIIAAIPANEMAENRFGRPVQLTALMQCLEGRTSFFIHFGDFFMSDFGGQGVVTIRADKEKARRTPMGKSTDNRALGLSGGNAIRLIKSLQGRAGFVVAAVPVNEAEVRATFSLAGSDAAIKAVRTACSW